MHFFNGILLFNFFKSQYIVKYIFFLNNFVLLDYIIKSIVAVIDIDFLANNNNG